MPKPVTRVDEVGLLSHPTPIDFDQVPGPDGLKVEVFLFQADRPQPVLVNGTVQFLLFERNVAFREVQTLKPYLVWTFSGAKLARHAVRSRLGWGYAADLRWGSRTPRAGSASLAAIYRSPDGRRVYSTPVTIQINGQ